MARKTRNVILGLLFGATLSFSVLAVVYSGYVFDVFYSGFKIQVLWIFSTLAAGSLAAAVGIIRYTARARTQRANAPPKLTQPGPAEVLTNPPTLVPCPVCGTEISSQAPNCVRCGHPMGLKGTVQAATARTARTAGGAVGGWLVVVAIVAIAYSFLTGRNPVDLVKSFSPGVEASVECEGTLVGVSCRVTRRSGSASATACWDVDFLCANRARTTAHACHEVPQGVGAMSTRLIAWKKFVGYSGCDQVLSSQVSNLTLSPGT